MDCINAEIDKELELIDLESTNSDHDYSDDEQLLDDSEFKLEKEKENKWLDLFLEKTSQQNQKYQELISDAQDVLDQVADNVKTASTCLNKDENVCHIKDVPHDTENLTTDETSHHIDDVITSKAHEVRDGDVIDFKISDDSGLDVVKLTTTGDKVNNITAFNTEEYLLHDEEFSSKVTNDCDDLLVQIESIESDRVAREQSLNEAVQNELSLLRNLQLEQMKLKDARDKNAAISIQRFYRGYMARKVYGTILANKILESRQQRSMERVRKIEMEMQRKREEQLKLEQIKKEKEECLRRLEEEKLMKEKEQKAEEE
uniref:Uncharacterized protein n=1 Tax=Ciona savignyi TaxID=51511 RepID=H2Z8V2_CIOSA